MKHLLTALVLLVVSTAAFGQNSGGKDEKAVLKANESFDKAVVDRDVDAYTRIVADDFVFTDHKGVVTNKAEEIEKLKNRKIKFVSGISSDVRVKWLGETAVVTGRFDARFKDANGKEHAFTERYTAVFTKRKGKWLMVAEHASEITN